MCESEPDGFLLAMEGDKHALSRLLELVDGEIRVLIKPRIGKQYRSAFAVDDVLQITYLEAFLQIRKLKPITWSTFKHWLFRVAENNLRDAIRGLNCQKRPPRHRQITEATAAESYTNLLDELGTTKSTPSLNAFRQEIREDINTALRRMPASYQMVIRMFDLEGHSAAEISRKINRSVGAVYMLKARAHEQLRNLLGQSTNYFSGSH